MNDLTKLFKPDDVVIELDGEKYRLVYDLNAFCEIEKIYDSVDTVLQMLLGTANIPELDKVTYNDAPVNADEIAIDGVPLTEYIVKNSTVKKAKHADTLNLLWAGLLHDHAIYDEFDEIKGYSISKAKVGAAVTFKNLREINAQIVLALLRDLLPPADENTKNATAPEQPAPKVISKTEA